MRHGRYGYAALLAVMGVSIVFGMLLGAKLDHPAIADTGSRAPSAATPPSAGPVVDFADIVERALPAVVTVTVTAKGQESEAGRAHPFLDEPFFRRFFGDTEEREGAPVPEQRRVGSGSGFVVNAEGFILTNNHVVQNFEKVEVTFQDNETVPATVVGADPSIDLALLKIEPGSRQLATLPLGDSDRLRVGQWVIAIGNPHDFDHTVTVGVVSGKERRVPLPATDTGLVGFIQTDAAINLGNSGGPLLDGQGNVVGINTAIRRQNYAEGIGFALPINQARQAMAQLREHGEVRRGWIGIRMNDVNIDEATRDYYGLPDTRGVLVTKVEERSPAQEAGIKAGDVIREVDGLAVRDNLDMISKISSRRPGDRVRLVVFRQGKSVAVAVTLGDRESGLVASDGGSALEREGPPRTQEPEESSGLGLTVETLDAEGRERLGFPEAQRGVLISSVDLQSEADRKGLRPTMVITALNDRPVRNVSEWDTAVRGLRPGSAVKLDVLAPVGDPERVQSFFVFVRAPESR
jgi:serine protease Do